MKNYSTSKNNMYLINRIGYPVDAKVVKVRWNNKERCSEIIYEVDNGEAYVVDTVTQKKRLTYLKMLHARASTIETAMERPNSTFQLSLASCFGNISKFYEIHAVLKPYHIGSNSVGVEVVMSFDKPY